MEKITSELCKQELIKLLKNQTSIPVIETGWKRISKNKSGDFTERVFENREIPNKIIKCHVSSKENDTENKILHMYFTSDTYKPGDLIPIIHDGVRPVKKQNDEIIPTKTISIPAPAVSNNNIQWDKMTPEEVVGKMRDITNQSLKKEKEKEDEDETKINAIIEELEDHSEFPFMKTGWKKVTYNKLSECLIEEVFETTDGLGDGSRLSATVIASFDTETEDVSVTFRFKIKTVEEVLKTDYVFGIEKSKGILENDETSLHLYVSNKTYYDINEGKFYDEEKTDEEIQKFLNLYDKNIGDQMFDDGHWAIRFPQDKDYKKQAFYNKSLCKYLIDGGMIKVKLDPYKD